ncbi:hypothetical protein BDZ91DRAFT_719645 [Kalaharituber pfeilii]|nr:hypothetical protein BDZ91DRAFT_719645 [Kalaharituber pfeilii]
MMGLSPKVCCGRGGGGGGGGSTGSVCTPVMGLSPSVGGEGGEGRNGVMSGLAGPSLKLKTRWFPFSGCPCELAPKYSCRHNPTRVVKKVSLSSSFIHSQGFSLGLMARGGGYLPFGGIVV